MFAIVTKRVDSDNACIMYMEALKPDFEMMIRRELATMPMAYVEVVLGLIMENPDERMSLREARKILLSSQRQQQQQQGQQPSALESNGPSQTAF